MHIHILAHVTDNNAAPEDPGYIVGYHRLSRHSARFGQVGQVFDGQGHAFMGDVTNAQVPISVHIPDQVFNLLPATQVPTAGLLAQLMQTEPDLDVAGPFAAGDPDVTPVVTRGIMIVPNEYVLPFLTTGMQPKDAYQTILGLVQQHNNIACGPLLEWLRLTLTMRAANTPPRTTIAPLQAPLYAPPEVHQSFVTYRLAIAPRDLPMLSPAGQHQGAHLIANGLSTLVQEQRIARQ